MPAVSPYFCRTLGKPKYPGLWNGCVLAWCPSAFGVTGGTLYDMSGRSRHGTLTNMTLSSAWEMRNGKTALALDATNDVVLGPQVPELSGATNFTIAGWIYAASVASLAGAIGTRSLNGVSGNGDNRVSLAWGFSTVFFTIDNGATAGSFSAPLAAAGLHHFAGTLAGGTGRIYVDGTQIAIGNPVSPTPITTHLFTLGCDFINRFWGGSYDDIRVYNRDLTDSEIKLLASRRGVAYEMLPPQVYGPPLSNLLDARRRAVVC